MDELIESFSLERVGKSGSRFDPDKAKWFNHQYLIKKSDNQLAIEFREFLRAKGFHIDIVELETLVNLVKERVSFTREIWDQTDFFFKGPDNYDAEVIKKRWTSESAIQLGELCELLEKSTDFSPSVTEAAVRGWIAEKGYNTGVVMTLFRLVIVGASRGPHIFDITSWIGKEETIKRIRKGISAIVK
jgi:glutamyl-tRNA synthetase